MANITNHANDNMRVAIYGTTDSGTTFAPLTVDANGNLATNMISGNVQYVDAAAMPTHPTGNSLVYGNAAGNVSAVSVTSPLPVNVSPFLYKNMTTGTTTTCKSGAGFLNAITVNTPVASATITIYDNTAGSAPAIGKITLGGTIASDQTSTYFYNIAFTTGLTVVTSAATDITISYI